MSNTTPETTAPSTNGGMMRYVVIGVLVLGAFFGAYRFAAARTGSAPQVAASGGLAGSTPASASGGDASGAACACCGSTAPTEGGLTGDLVEGKAVVEGDVQKISVDLSKGYYEPNQIVLKAGVPAEITFGQSSGCTAQVVSEELGFGEDLTAGPATVELPALEKGEYPFYCGMQMVFGKIVVE
ncbi:MAG TPA: cupredoxin domain-containing protein [Coriobacteriia bacterium]|nr:cupredoxin domain-containing protein [Coriobacteriia bacterium]